MKPPGTLRSFCPHCLRPTLATIGLVGALSCVLAAQAADPPSTPPAPPACRQHTLVIGAYAGGSSQSGVTLDAAVRLPTPAR